MTVAAQPFDCLFGWSAPIQVNADGKVGDGRQPALNAEVLGENLSIGYRTRLGACLPEAELITHLLVQIVGQCIGPCAGPYEVRDVDRFERRTNVGDEPFRSEALDKVQEWLPAG